MITDFAEQLYRLACNDVFFQNDKLIRSYDFSRLHFPVQKNIISFGSEKNDRLHFLLGYDLFLSGDEKVIVTVLTDQAKGGAFCEQYACDVCMKLLELDTDKSIISVAADRCVFDPNAFAYRIKITFGLRESSVSREEE